jgi:hypothetical protein
MNSVDSSGVKYGPVPSAWIGMLAKRNATPALGPLVGTMNAALLSWYSYWGAAGLFSEPVEMSVTTHRFSWESKCRLSGLENPSPPLAGFPPTA